MAESEKREYGAYLERVSPEQSDQPVFQEHLARYQFSGPYARGKRVLDAASGSGYGTAFLARWAAFSVGVDTSPEALDQARGYRLENGAFAQMSCIQLAFRDGVFDLICSLEFIEHTNCFREALGEFSRVLRPGGILVISTPNRKPDRPVPPPNPFHTQEFNAEEFSALLREFFPIVKTFGQFKGIRAQAVSQGTPLKRTLRRFDPLGMRRLLPRGLYHRLLRLIRAPLPQDLKPHDYEFGREGVEEAEWLLSVCHKA